MKKMIIPAAIACLLFILSAWGNTNGESNELTQMGAVAQSLEMDVKEWRITLKESVPQANIYSIIESIGQYAKVEKTVGGEADRYFAENVHKDGGISESFIVIVPSAGQAQLIIELKGASWDEEVEKTYIKHKNKLIKAFFTDNVKSFACLQAASDDMINADEFVTKLKLDLNIKHLMKQEENIGNTVNKKSFYGYIPLWPAKMAIADEPMNMQAAITNNRGSGSKLVIGTPILLHEY